MERAYSQKTIKILFGRATQCAYPDCDEHLIFEDRGRLSVTAEIAHIRSGVPNGPRHDPDYPAELINAEENLLLLCGKHHKPVDEHESTYPVGDLIEWKRRQVAAGPARDFTENQVAQIFQHYDLSQLGLQGFEWMCQALTVHVLGPGTEVHGGLGPDGRRDASFLGRAQSYPNLQEPWDGYVVMQAIYMSKPARAGDAAARLRSRIKADLAFWSARGDTREGNGKLPDYFIFATNYSLSTAPNTGGMDQIDALIRQYADSLDLKGWAVWDELVIGALLDAYPQVRYAVSSLTSSNNALTEVLPGLAGPETRSRS